MRALLAGEAGPDWDVVLLTCKAYDLDAAVEALRPAMDERTAVLPLLNGISHLERLEAAFGPERVLGGLTKVATLLTPEGAVRQFAPPQLIEFGELDGRMSPRVLAFQAAFAGTVVQAEAAPDVLRRMWEKLVIFGTVATATVLMRGTLGEVAAAPGGAAWLERLLRPHRRDRRRARPPRAGGGRGGALPPLPPRNSACHVLDVARP